ncbi:GNAT family N-acetyltransferase [Fictibacillus sp. 26RED30]|uniref:GNAT family N-acetyltransferase n=1 Tax=Fictibacillus sp. 26RED30 TaxID=2745877 RepID=UPI0018CFE5CA|nr:GNAT family N-acetyltransferase [Fictibacillus sp. 26RED30]MBH0159367.1 GNAT family N-acetyltransferase [Fictibacillus sp. 26RED30]
MYETRWANDDEITIMADYWYRMACEMGEIDEIPKPDIQRIEEVKNLFIKETNLGNLKFRVAIDSNDKIVACAGGLLRKEYPYPLAEEQSLFGWVLAVYTLKNHRNNGLAYKLVDEICLWLSQKGARRARLWSSSSGRKVYENLGFKNMMDMSKPLT